MIDWFTDASSEATDKSADIEEITASIDKTNQNIPNQEKATGNIPRHGKEEIVQPSESEETVKSQNELTEENAKEKLESLNQVEEEDGTDQDNEEFINQEDSPREDSFNERLEDSNTGQSEGVITDTDANEDKMKHTDQAETERDANYSIEEDVNPETTGQKVPTELEEGIPDIDNIKQKEIDSSIKDEKQESTTVRSDTAMEVPIDSDEDQKQKTTDTDGKELEAEINQPDTIFTAAAEGLLKRCSGVGSVATSVLLTQFV